MSLARARTLASHVGPVGACLLLVSGDCGSSWDRGSTGARSDLVSVELVGPEPLAFDVTVRVTSVQPESVTVELSVDELVRDPVPMSNVFMSLICDQGGGPYEINLRYSPPANLYDIFKIPSPGEAKCLVTITPETDLERSINLDWRLGAYLEWSDPDIDVDVTIAVAPL